MPVPIYSAKSSPAGSHRRCRWFHVVLGVSVLIFSLSPVAMCAGERRGENWIGTWAASAQPFIPGRLQSFTNQSLRLIVRTSAGGTKVRIRVSNTYGDHALLIGSAHIALRISGADIDPGTDRVLKFRGHWSTSIPAGTMVVSDPVELNVSALSDLAVSFYFPETAAATTSHILALQTSYVAVEHGDSTAKAKFPDAKPIHSWPFLTGVDVVASPRAAAIVAFGSSLTDGDGTTLDTNARWPNVLAERLQKDAAGKAKWSVLNEGIIGNRLLRDSPQAGTPFGGSLGQAGLTRFDRDVLSQAGVRYVIVGLGINDIAFPGSLTPANEAVSAESIISGYRQLIARAHRKKIRIIGTTNSPFEDAFLKTPPVEFFTAEKEAVRKRVNSWILTSGEFDAVVDLDQVLRDPDHPTRLLPVFDSGDHLHPNDAGAAAEANAMPLALFESH